MVIIELNIFVNLAKKIANSAHHIIFVLNATSLLLLKKINVNVKMAITTIIFATFVHKIVKTVLNMINAYHVIVI